MEVDTRLNQVRSIFKQLEKHALALDAAANKKPSKQNGTQKLNKDDKRKSRNNKVESDANGTSTTTAAASQASSTAATPSSSPDTAVPTVPSNASSAAASSSSTSSSSSSESDSSPSLSPFDRAMLFISGDFNQSQLYSAVHRLIVEGRVEAGFIDVAAKKVTTPTTLTQPFTLRSAYQPSLDNSWPKYTFHNNHYAGSPYNARLDFIYATPRTMGLVGCMEVVTDKEHERIEGETSLPNEIIPSDHLPVGATFYVPVMDRNADETS